MVDMLINICPTSTLTFRLIDVWIIPEAVGLMLLVRGSDIIKLPFFPNYSGVRAIRDIE